MESVSSSAFMYYCISSRKCLFDFLERSDNFTINNLVLDFVKKQEEFLVHMINMEQTNTSYERNNTQNNSTRTGNTEQRNFGGRFNMEQTNTSYERKNAQNN